MKQDEVVKLLSPLTVQPDIPQGARDTIGKAITEAVSPLQYDEWIYRAVVVFLGVTIVATVFGGIYLALKADPNIKLPDGIIAIGSAAVGALAGLLAPSPKSG